ncbi:MAG: 4-oxalocrotonate tautomerase [Chloroflexota bacterium]
MPQIHVTLPKNAWSKEEKAVVVEKLTAAMAEAGVETGVAERASVPEANMTPFINVFIEETSEGGYAIGGQVLG